MADATGAYKNEPPYSKGSGPNGQTKKTRNVYQTPLAEIEFDAASDVIKYADMMRKVGRTEQLELSTAADELEAILGNSCGNFYERHVARRKARKVANLLRAAGDHARAVAVEGVKIQRAFKREYADILNPVQRRNKGLDWRH